MVTPFILEAAAINGSGVTRMGLWRGMDFLESVDYRDRRRGGGVWGCNTPQNTRGSRGPPPEKLKFRPLKSAFQIHFLETY